MKKLKNVIHCLNNKISRRGELNSPFFIQENLQILGKNHSQIYYTGNSPNNGNGDSSKKRANAIRPYGIHQLIHFRSKYEKIEKCNSLFE